MRASPPAFSFAAAAAATIVAVVAGTAITSRCLAAAPNSQPFVLNPAIHDLFEQLGSDDPRLREDASQRLSNYGDLIRPALVDASRDEDVSPELRGRAQRLLCALNWARPDDLPGTRQALSEYRSTDPEVRANAARRLSGSGPGARAALLRLLEEEPSQEVRWVIAGQLRTLLTPDADRRLFRGLETTADAPSLAIAGWACQAADTDRATRLLRRAVELFARHPCDDGGAIEFILNTLYVRALNAGDYDGAADAVRAKMRYGDKPFDEAVLDLFALHAQYGPRRGFEADVRAAETCFEKPELTYVLGRMYERMGQPLLATACYRAAGLSGLASQGTHRRLAEFLIAPTRQWFELAQVELRAVLATNGPDKEVQDADACLGLARCAAGLGDDAAAAELLRRTLQIAAALPGRQVNNPAAFQADIHWYELRAAKTRGDVASIAECVEKLLPRGGAGRNNNADGNASAILANPELAIDLVTALKTLGRNDKAAEVFEQAYGTLSEALRQAPDDPELLNNIAWLCARCDEKIEDAIRWSAEAVRLAPANAAYLDTAAEAVAHQGNWRQAIELESAALRLQPGDRFMTAQLVRFRGELGKADGSAPATAPSPQR